MHTTSLAFSYRRDESKTNPLMDGLSVRRDKVGVAAGGIWLWCVPNLMPRLQSVPRKKSPRNQFPDPTLSLVLRRANGDNCESHRHAQKCGYPRAMQVMPASQDRQNRDNQTTD
jgi:hypothetical protein